MENVANETRGDHGADNCEVQQQGNGTVQISCCLHNNIHFSQYIGKGPY